MFFFLNKDVAIINIVFFVCGFCMSYLCTCVMFFDYMSFDLPTLAPDKSLLNKDNKACECLGNQPKDFHLLAS